MRLSSFGWPDSRALSRNGEAYGYWWIQTSKEQSMPEPKKKRLRLSEAWHEAKDLIIAHRGRLALGAVLMLVNRLVGLILPASSKYIIDEVIGKGRAQLLTPIAIVA